MTFTRANAEQELVGRASGKMAAAGLAVTVVGTNADLNAPMLSAFRKMGVEPGSQVVSDTDFTLLESSQLDEFLDRAELRLLENILGNLDLTDVSIGPRRESLGQIAEQTEKAINRVSARIAKEYGAGVAGLTADYIDLNFAAKSSDFIGGGDA